MVTIAALWLPILLSAVAVFLVSSLVHMVLPWHKGDFPAVPDQDRVMAALRPFAIPPGDYAMPRPKDMKEMGTPEFAAKMTQGPVMSITVRPNGPMTMGASLGKWFIFVLVISTISAYVSSRALPAGAEYLEAFRFAGTTAFVAYAGGTWPATIWYGRGVGLALKETFDGLLYAAVTAGVFGWLWPH